jgi:hypothetical protein
MKIPTIKYPSGLEVSLTAFLLKMTSLDIGQARRRSINRDSSGAMDVETPTFNNQKEEKHEHRSFQGQVEPIQW